MLSVGTSVDYPLAWQALLLLYSSIIADLVGTVLMYLEIKFAHSLGID